MHRRLESFQLPEQQTQLLVGLLGKLVVPGDLPHFLQALGFPIVFLLDHADGVPDGAEALLGYLGLGFRL